MVRERYLELDYLRGIAIMLVVMGHVLNFGLDISHSTAMTLIALFEMPVFFAVSGYLSFRNDEWIKQSREISRFGKRSAMLLLPMMVWSLLLNICDGDVSLNISTIYREEYWFFLVLWWFNLAYLIISYLSVRFRFSLWVNLAVYAFLQLVIIILRTKDIDLCGFFPIHNIQYYFPFFAIGILMRKYEKIRYLVLNEYTYAVGLILVGIGLYFRGMQSYAIFLLGAIGAVVVAWSACRRIKGDNHCARALGYVGRNTLPIYAIHYLFLAPLPLCIRDMCLVPMGFTLQVTVSFACAALIILLCLLMDRIISINPITKLLFFGQIKARQKVQRC